MLYAYGRENQMMMLQGAAPQQIDRALKDFGMAMGPNAVGDLAGLDVGYRVRREHKGLSADPCYYRVADLMVEAGRLGQKTGRGIYAYVAGSREPQVDPEVEPMIAAEAQRLGVTRRSFSDAEIVERCMLALVNEGARILQEGIARSAEDIDVIWCNGYGYPRFRGGPIFYAQSLGIQKVVRSLKIILAQETAPSAGSRPHCWNSGPLARRANDRHRGESLSRSISSLGFSVAHDGVLEVVLGNTERRNAVDDQGHRDLSRVWVSIDADAEVRSVLVRGAVVIFRQGRLQLDRTYPG